MARKNPPSQHLPVPIDDEPTEIGEGMFGDEDMPMDDLAFEDLEDLPMDDERTSPGYPMDVDSFEDSQVDSPSRVVLDPRTQITGRFRNPILAAQEASQGPWRDRAFIPRGVVPREQVLESMEQALQIAAMQRGNLDRVRAALRAELMPLLRQAIEQAGGDGFDAWLATLVAPPGKAGKAGKDPLLWQVAQHIERFNRAATPQALLAESKKLVETVKKALFAPSLKKLSLRFLEEEFEGRIDVDTLLAILFCTDEELDKRRQQVERTLDNMRIQMRGLPGSSDGLMWNFSRLKVEKRVIEAEQGRRGPPRG